MGLGRGQNAKPPQIRKILPKPEVKSQYCLLSDSRLGKFLKHVGTEQDKQTTFLVCFFGGRKSITETSFLKATLLDEGEQEMVQQILPSSVEPALPRRRRFFFRKMLRWVVTTTAATATLLASFTPFTQVSIFFLTAVFHFLLGGGFHFFKIFTRGIDPI